MLKKLGLTAAIVSWTLAAAAAADVLVTRDGERIETRGPWKVKGRQVVFTSLQGVLSSMRLSEVDLDASAEASRPPEPVQQVEPEKAAAKEAKDRPPVLVLTNDNLGDRRSEPSPGDAEELGQQIGQAFGELFSGLSQGMMTGLAEGLGGEEAGRQIREQIDGEMSEGAGAFGEFIAVAVEIGLLAAPIKAEHDLETPEGMRAAADDMDRLAAEVRRKTEGASPEIHEMLEEMAGQFEELAELARRDPEAAVQLRKQRMEENAKEQPSSFP